MEQFKLEKMDIDLGDEFNEAKVSLNSFKESIEQLKSYIKDPKNVIYEYFSELRNKIDLDRELKKKKVDEHYFGLIDELNEVEKDCKKNELKNIEVFNKVIENEEKNLSKFKEDLDLLKIDTKKWSDLQTESNLHTAIVKRKINDLESELFSNNDFTYEREEFDDILKKAKIMRTPIKQINLKKLGSFNLNLNKIKKLSGITGPNIFSNSFIFNELVWKLKLKNDDGNHLACFIRCDPGINKEVSCKLKIQLNNLDNSTKNIIKEYDHKYTEEGGYGCDKLISFEDLFNNDFYDRENDSIYFSISIQIKNIWK